MNNRESVGNETAASVCWRLFPFPSFCPAFGRTETIIQQREDEKMNESDFLDYKENRKQQMRKMLPDPSEATLTAWKYQDRKDEVHRKNAESRAQEAPDLYNVKIISEVKIK